MKEEIFKVSLASLPKCETKSNVSLTYSSIALLESLTLFILDVEIVLALLRLFLSRGSSWLLGFSLAALGCSSNLGFAN